MLLLLPSLESTSRFVNATILKAMGAISQSHVVFVHRSNLLGLKMSVFNYLPMKFALFCHDDEKSCCPSTGKALNISNIDLNWFSRDKRMMIPCLFQKERDEVTGVRL